MKDDENIINLEERRSAERAADEHVLSEDTVATEFVQRHKGQALFDHSSKRWHIYTAGGRWQPDQTEVALYWTRALARAMASKEERRRIGTLKFARGVEGFARSDPAVAVTADHWDQELDALGTETGVVDLRTGDFLDPAPDLFITRSVACDPSDVADCRRFLQFLDEATGKDQAVKDFLQRFFGYCLSGETTEQMLLFIHGPGGTGKTVLADTMMKLMGTYATSAAMETFTAAHHDRHLEELARLHGPRMVVSSETEAGRKWAENRIKLLTGGDQVTARYMRQNSFTFKPQFKLLFLGNHAPGMVNPDSAMRRRFQLLPFLHKPATPDPHLEEILTEEWPAILRWAINGAVDWYTRGGLVVPKTVTDATDRYFEDQDTLGMWLEECCEVDLKNDHLMERSTALFESWNKFAQAHGEMVGTQTTFNEKMRHRGLEVKRIKALLTRGCRGIRLKPTKSWQETEDDRAP